MIDQSTSYPPKDDRPAANRPNIIPPVVSKPVEISDPSALCDPGYEPPKNISNIGKVFVVAAATALVYNEVKEGIIDSVNDSKEQLDDTENEDDAEKEILKGK